MQPSFISALLVGAAVTTACVLPTDTLSNNITTGFGILIQNPAYPIIHDRYMNLLPAGGGDQHLFLSPVANPTFNLVLNSGALAQGTIHAVIGGEYSEVDNTTKMFMTERNEPKAIFQPVYGCDPDTDAVQIQLAFVTWEQQPAGGLICVRVASGNRGYEFRYSPPNNPAFDPTNPCMPVTMVVVPPGNVISTSTVSTSTSAATTTVGGTTTTTTSSSAITTATGPVINGQWTYQGCQTEATNQRALTGASFAADTMTLEACATFCTNFLYFGTEYARECYCGNSFNAGSVPAPATDCNFPCKGNLLETCGAGLRLSIFKKGALIQSSSSVTTTTSSSSSSSTDSSSSTTLTTSTTSSPSSTSTSSSSETSTTSSTDSSSTSTSTSTSSSAAPSTTSSTDSSSASTSTSTSTSTSATTSSSPLPYTDETANGFAFVGCAPEERHATDAPGRTLTGALYADDTMTNPKCLAFCASKGYTFAGTEWTRECWCGNTVAPGRRPQTTVASLAGCNFKCGGDQTQFCGGDSWLSLYQACPVGGPCVNAVFT